MTSSLPHTDSPPLTPPHTPTQRQNKKQHTTNPSEVICCTLALKSHYPALIINMEINPDRGIVTAAHTLMLMRSTVNIWLRFSLFFFHCPGQGAQSRQTAARLKVYPGSQRAAEPLIRICSCFLHDRLNACRQTHKVAASAWRFNGRGGKWSRSGCGAARMVKAGCSRGTVRKKIDTGVSSNRADNLMLLICLNSEHYRRWKSGSDWRWHWCTWCCSSRLSRQILAS